MYKTGKFSSAIRDQAGGENRGQICGRNCGAIRGQNRGAIRGKNCGVVRGKNCNVGRVRRWVVGCAGAFMLALLPGPAVAISEAEFIAKVLAHDKLLEEAQIGLDIKRIERDASRANYANWKAEVTMDLGYRYRDLDRDNGTTSDYTSQTRKYEREVGLAVEKRFLSHPGSLRLGIRRNKDGGTERVTDVPTTTQLMPSSRSHRTHDLFFDHHVEEFETRHYIQFDYPLLKHDSNALSLKTHHRDIIDLQRQQLSFYETKEDFLEARLSDYLLWVLHQRQADINRELLDKLRALQPRDAAEEALLKSAALQVEQDLSEAELELQAVKEKLSILLDDPAILHATAEYDFTKRIAPLRGDLSAYLKAHNRELYRIALSMELNRIEIAYYENQNLPKLDFGLRAEYDSDKGNTRSSELDDDRTNYTAALEFSYPLGGNISNKANLQKFQLGVRRLEISYEDELQDIVADAQRLHALLTLDETRYLEAIDAAIRSAAIQLRDYQDGGASFRDLLQAYRDERDAKIDHIDDSVDYQINSIEYDNLLDRIIETPCRVALVECTF